MLIYFVALACGMVAVPVLHQVHQGATRRWLEACGRCLAAFAQRRLAGITLNAVTNNMVAGIALAV